MARREFPTRIRVAAALRATDGRGVMRCETLGCNAVLVPGRWQLDHIRPDGLDGEPSLSNAACICEACWKAKNPQDTRIIAKAKRRQATHLGAKLRSKGFRPPASKDRSCRKVVERRPLFVETMR